MKVKKELDLQELSQLTIGGSDHNILNNHLAMYLTDRISETEASSGRGSIKTAESSAHILAEFSNDNQISIGAAEWITAARVLHLLMRSQNPVDGWGSRMSAHAPSRCWSKNLWRVVMSRGRQRPPISCGVSRA
jgi:hypothetical protein